MSAAAAGNYLAFSLHSGISISAGTYSCLTRVLVILSVALEQCISCTKAAVSLCHCQNMYELNLLVIPGLSTCDGCLEIVAAAPSYQNTEQVFSGAAELTYSDPDVLFHDVEDVFFPANS